MEEKLITTREASGILGISEQDVINLANAQELPSIKLGGEYLRYRKKDILHLKNELHKKLRVVGGPSRFSANLKEFFYFYDFYVLCSCAIVVLLWIIFKDIHS